MFSSVLDDAEDLLHESYALGTRLEQPAADAYRMGQLFALRHAQGRAPEIEPELLTLIERFPGLPTLRCDLCLLLADAGERDRARGLLEALCADDFAVLPRDSLFLASLAILAEAAVELRHAGHAASLSKALAPYADRNLIQGVPTPWGAGAWHLARLAASLGERDAAATYGRTAQRLHQRWGATWYGDPLAGLGSSAAGPLSRRETEIIKLVASGASNKEIAAALQLSIHTVERHVANIFTKLSLRNRAQAAAWAHQHLVIG